MFEESVRHENDEIPSHRKGSKIAAPLLDDGAVGINTVPDIQSEVGGNGLAIRKRLTPSVSVAGLCAQSWFWKSGETARMLEWLLAPIDSSRPHLVGPAISWHARMMVLAWGFLAPLGIVVARFFKVTPRQDWPRELDNKAWWRGHLALQYAGGGATVLALALILMRPDAAQAGGPHRVLGWTAVGLAAAQFLAGWLRGTKGGPTAPAPDGSWSGTTTT